MEYLPRGNAVFIIGYISYILGGFFCKKIDAKQKMHCWKKIGRPKYSY